MSKRTKNGFTIIELITFIVILGIVSGGLLIGMNQAQRYSDIPRDITQASFLANARMQIILMNRAINGYATLNDPCTVTPSLAICIPLDTYETNYNFTVQTPTITGNNPKNITVTVTGAGNATVKASVYDYANN